MSTSLITRIAITLGLAGIAVLSPTAAHARPACDCASQHITAAGPYVEPLAALGGRTLAQYLAQHQAHRLAVPGA